MSGDEPTELVTSDELVCDGCGEKSPADSNWCEACGANLDQPSLTPGAGQNAAAAAEPCISCAAAPSEITSDGWCQLCGTKQPASGDHVSDDHGWFAVVSDRGRVHRTNEDAGAVGATPTRLALVVCDGVSTTDNSEDASQAAASTALATLLGAGIDTDPGTESDRDALMVQAAAHAQAAVVVATPAGTRDPPSCTFVAATARNLHVVGGQDNRPGTDSEPGPDSPDSEPGPDSPGSEPAVITIGWLGDSRAYWLDTDEARELSHDHGWAAEQRRLGILSEEAIAADRRGSSITRWLGADAFDVTPEVVEIQVTGPGLLLLCSDGLWNYAQTPQAMHALVAEQVSPTDPDSPTAMADLAERLVTFAKESGGHDNITVALARFPLRLDRPESTTPDQATTPHQFDQHLS